MDYVDVTLSPLRVPSPPLLSPFSLHSFPLWQLLSFSLSSGTVYLQGDPLHILDYKPLLTPCLPLYRSPPADHRIQPVDDNVGSPRDPAEEERIPFQKVRRIVFERFFD